MGRPHRDIDARGRVFNLDTTSVLARCEEILQAVYGRGSPPRENVQLNSKSSVGVSRVIRRLMLDSHSHSVATSTTVLREFLRKLSPGFSFNLARHARIRCTQRHPKCNTCPLISFCPKGIGHSAASSKGKPIAVDICSGAGGLSAGFRREGFHVAFAVEKDRNAAQSFRVNNPGVPVIEADARKIRPSRILQTLSLKRGQIAAVMAGPPCQGFSAAGPRKPRAKRNFLFRSVAYIAKGLGARLLVMENVPGLKRVNGVRFEDKILACFRRFGYVGKSVEVDASGFGVPQRRKRLIFLCARRGCTLSSFNLRPLRLNTKATVLNALTNLPQPHVGKEKPEQRGAGRMIRNHRAMAHGPNVIRKIRRIRPGKGPISYRRLRPDLAHTLIAGHRAMPVHPRQHRTITVREAARLQTMPDSFRFLGPHADQPLQVANVVPYRLSRAIARSLLAALHLHL